MKKTFFVLGVAIFAILKTTAQISHGGEPQFWKEALSKSIQIPTKKIIERR